MYLFLCFWRFSWANPARQNYFLLSSIQENPEIVRQVGFLCSGSSPRFFISASYGSWEQEFSLFLCNMRNHSLPFLCRPFPKDPVQADSLDLCRHFCCRGACSSLWSEWATHVSGGRSVLLRFACFCFDVETASCIWSLDWHK